MPTFNTVNRGQAWSDLSGQNTSQRVRTNNAQRPEAEIRLSSRKIEIRTGARVTRARGPWVTFKRGMTTLTGWLPKVMGGLSKQEQTERTLRHAEYRFDRHANRLVEDLANKPDLSMADVSRRLNKLADEADRICAKDPTVSKDYLAERFATNLQESLQALARRKPQAMNQVLSAFERGGAAHDLSNRYTLHSSPDKDWIASADQHDASIPQTYYDQPRAMTPADYVRSGILEIPNEEQHDFAQKLIGRLADVRTQAPAIRQQAAEAEQTVQLKSALKSGRPFQGRLAFDLRDDASLRRHLGDLNSLPTVQAGRHEVADKFLADVGRAPMRLTDANGNSVEIRQELKNRQLNNGQAEANSFATEQLAHFADSFGFTGDEQQAATRNLSRLMSQEAVGSADVAATARAGRDVDGLVLMTRDGTENFGVSCSVDGNGDLIFQSTKTSELGMFNTPDSGMQPFDPDSSNNSSASLTLKVRREDLAREPLRFEIVSASASYNLDIQGDGGS